MNTVQINKNISLYTGAFKSQKLVCFITVELLNRRYQKSSLPSSLVPKPLFRLPFTMQRCAGEKNGRFFNSLVKLWQKLLKCDNVRRIYFFHVSRRTLIGTVNIILSKAA